MWCNISLHTGFSKLISKLIQGSGFVAFVPIAGSCMFGSCTQNRKSEEVASFSKSNKCFMWGCFVWVFVLNFLWWLRKNCSWVYVKYAAHTKLACLFALLQAGILKQHGASSWGKPKMETLGILRFVFGSVSYAHLKCGWLLVRSRARPLLRGTQTSGWFRGRTEKRGGLVCFSERNQHGKNVKWRSKRVIVWKRQKTAEQRWDSHKTKKRIGYVGKQRVISIYSGQDLILGQFQSSLVNHHPSGSWHSERARKQSVPVQWAIHLQLHVFPPSLHSPCLSPPANQWKPLQEDSPMSEYPFPAHVMCLVSSHLIITRLVLLPLGCFHNRLNLSSVVAIIRLVESLKTEVKEKARTLGRKPDEQYINI